MVGIAVFKFPLKRKKKRYFLSKYQEDKSVNSSKIISKDETKKRTIYLVPKSGANLPHETSQL